MREQEKIGRVAAFFDLDGTLVGPPSLEQRFFADLRLRRAIPMRNYLLWLARAAWLAPLGIETIWHANKAYLRGISTDERECDKGGRAARPSSGQSVMAVPRFFPAGLEQVAWHARQGHAVVLVSGTLAPLAQEMALALVVRLAVRGIEASVAVCATRLEKIDGRWTGRIVGDAMFGKAKGRAVRRLAGEKGFELAQCYSYGDREDDKWMLEAVGRPVAVNPTSGMERIARERDWAVLRWAEKDNSTQKAQRTQRRETEKVA
jgi:HAD superfamily hydrolase (TIGR01490 family)